MQNEMDDIARILRFAKLVTKIDILGSKFDQNRYMFVKNRHLQQQL